MSVLQLEDLVSHQLRISYLDEIADGVGERLLTINDSFLNSPSFKAAGWRPMSTHSKGTHSPPIPTVVTSEYFQAPRPNGLTLEDPDEDGGMLTAAGADTVGPGAATKRRRRREQMEEDDSSDLSDESEDDLDQQRAAQQIRFAKMPLRHRAGSSPTRPSRSRAASGVSSPRPLRRGSQSALGVVKEKARRDTVTSSEVSSDNDLEGAAAIKHRETARAVARAARLQAKISEEPVPGIKRADTIPLVEEEEDSDDASDLSGDYAQSIDSASILDRADNAINPSPTGQFFGTPPKHLIRQSTVRKSHPPVPVNPTRLEALPPPQSVSQPRPASMLPAQSLLSAALKAKEHSSKVPFQHYAHHGAQEAKGSIACRIYVPFSKSPGKPVDVLIQPRIRDGQGNERPPIVADLIGLSLYRYLESKREPALLSTKLDINWWTLRMVEEGGEVDDDFPAFDRTKPLATIATANNASMRGGGRMRSNSTAYDEFALVAATEGEFRENKEATPQEEEENDQPHTSQDSSASAATDATDTSKSTTASSISGTAVAVTKRHNPIITTAYRPNAPFADAPQVRPTTPTAARGQQKLLRVHIMSSDAPPGQMLMLDVTTETYFAEVLDLICRKRTLEKANHVLKLPGSGAVAMLDRPVSSIGNVSDIELHRRRFATDGPLMMTGSPSSASPRAMAYSESQPQRRPKKGQMLGPHPLAQESVKQEEIGAGAYKKYTVWRKQPMRIAGLSERMLVIDGEYIHIMPASGGKAVQGGKTTTVHFSNVVGCKVPRKHLANVKLVVYKATESKRYDFETKSVDEAAEIVRELKRGITPYQDV